MEPQGEQRQLTKQHEDRRISSPPFTDKLTTGSWGILRQRWKATGLAPRAGRRHPLRLSPRRPYWARRVISDRDVDRRIGRRTQDNGL